MAKSRKLNQKQFAEITAALHNYLFLGGPPVPTDCEALLAYIQAAQAIYTRDCPIASPPMSMRKAAKKAVKK